MKIKNPFFAFLLFFVFSVSASAQLRAYKFEYNDRFGGKQKCYLTLRSFDIVWDKASANILFNCYENETSRTRNIEPRRIFVLPIKGTDFTENVLKPITASETGKPRAEVQSDWLWKEAEEKGFVEDFVWDDAAKKMTGVKKSLTALGAVRVDVPFESLGAQ